MKNIGFIGLGIMGLPMAINLQKKSGASVAGFDVFPEPRQKFQAAGGKAADHADAVFAGSEVIFLCLPSNELLRDNVTAALNKAKAGTVLVDMGSTAPGVIRALEPEVRKRGMHLIDSPVSGGDVGARDATLAIMCGGERPVFDQVQPLLSCMGSTVTYMGGSGNGSVAKLANNIIAGIYLGTIGEAFAFAVKAGLDPKTLFEAIRGGFAGSKVMDVKVPKILSRDFSPAARTAVHQKDLKNAVKLAEEMGVRIPMAELALDLMNQLEATGRVNEDHSAVCKIYEEQMGVEIK